METVRPLSCGLPVCREGSFVFSGPRQKPRWRFDLPPCAVTHPAGSPCERVLRIPRHRGLGGVAWTLLKPRSPLPAFRQVFPQPNPCPVARMIFLKVKSNHLTPHLHFWLALCCSSIKLQTSTLLASPRGPAIPGALTTSFSLSWVHSAPVLLLSLRSLKTPCCFPTTGPPPLLPALQRDIGMSSSYSEDGSFLFNLEFQWTVFRGTPSTPPVILSYFHIFPFITFTTVCSLVHVSLFSCFSWLLLWPAACFCITRELRMVSVFQMVGKKKEQQVMTQENYAKFKFQHL